MTRDKDRKRIIRDRMKKTGESYTTARTYVISKAKPQQVAPPRLRDAAALAGMSDDVIAARTGRTWREWVRVLDADNAAAMPHRDIAALLHDTHSVGRWWAQTVTVGYERIKGLRERGQLRSGMYEVSKSRTFDVPLETLFAAWADEGMRRRWLGVEATVRTATAQKSMRLQWPDGTIVAVWYTAKPGRKSMVVVAHTKLRDKAASDRAKAYWADRFDALAPLLIARPHGTVRTRTAARNGVAIS